MAGVVVAVATVPAKPLADTTLALVTVPVPVPAGTPQVPSPRQKVVALAEVPEFKFVVGKFPVTSAVRDTAPKVGAPAALPCKSVVDVPAEVVAKALVVEA
jgi:hypothetical protein